MHLFQQLIIKWHCVNSTQLKNKLKICVVPLMNHKTGNITPAMILFNNAFHRSTVIPYVDDRNEALIFFTYGWMKMGSSLVLSQLYTFWNYSQGSKVRIINSATEWMFTTPKVHSYTPELKQVKDVIWMQNWGLFEIIQYLKDIEHSKHHFFFISEIAFSKEFFWGTQIFQQGLIKKI